MKALVRSLLKVAAPSVLEKRQSFMAKRMAKAWFWDRQNAFAQAHFPDGEIKVVSGPFAGMRYFNEVVFGAIEVRWLGAFEMELHPVLNKVAERGYQTIIDIGSAEGYYSVGLARMVPQAQVLSYEIDAGSKAQQLRLAELNGVTSLSLKGRCDHAELNRVIDGPTLIICDIEGAEIPLLDPGKAPRLRTADILLELHQPGGVTYVDAERIFRERFGASHQIERIVAQPRTANALAAAGLNPLCVGPEFFQEHRDPAQVWLWMRASR